MNNSAITINVNEVANKDESVTITFVDAWKCPIEIELPTRRQLKEIFDLSSKLTNHVDFQRSFFLDSNETNFTSEFEKLSLRQDQYSSEATYWTHLSSLALFSGDLKGSIDILKQGLQGCDNDILRHKLSERCLMSGDLKNSRNYLQHANWQNDPEGIVQMAASSATKSELEETLQFGLKSFPDSYQINFFVGALNIAQTDYKNAIRHFRIASRSQYGSSALHTNLAFAHYKIGNTDKALNSLRTSLKFNSLNRNALLLYTDIQISEGEYDDALAMLKSHQELDNTSPYVWERIGEIKYRRREYKDALSALRHLASLRENSLVWNNIALCFQRMGKPEEARKSFNHALSISESIDEKKVVFSSYISVLVDQRKFDLAVACSLAFFGQVDFEELVKDPECAGVCANYLSSLSEVGAVKDAVQESQRLVESTETSVELRNKLYIFLTYSYSKTLVDKEKAVSLANEILNTNFLDQVDPPEVRHTLLNNAVYALLVFDELELAEPHMNTLRKVSRRYPHAAATLGMFYLKQGDLDKGANFYKLSTHLAKSKFLKSLLSQKMSLEVGKTYMAKGIVSTAKLYLDRAFKADASKEISSEARKILQTLK